MGRNARSADQCVRVRTIRYTAAPQGFVKHSAGHMKTHQKPEGESDTWLTPPEIFNVLGSFDLDPASPELAPGQTLPWPMATMNISPSMNGLDDSWWRPFEWSGRKPRVWLNPPFNRYQRPKWMKRMAEHGNGIMLIPAATETKAFFDYVWSKADAVCFVRGRPHCHYADGTRARANCGCSIALVAYGGNNVEVLEGSGLGHVVRLTPPLQP